MDGTKCSARLYRDVDHIAKSLACHHKYRGIVALDGLSSSATARRVCPSVVCASSRDSKVVVTPTRIKPRYASGDKVSFSQAYGRGIFRIGMPQSGYPVHRLVS